MIRLYFAALPLALLSSPALAEPTCKDALTPVPMWQVAKTFEDGRVNQRDEDQRRLLRY